MNEKDIEGTYSKWNKKYIWRVQLKIICAAHCYFLMNNTPFTFKPSMKCPSMSSHVLHGFSNVFFNWGRSIVTVNFPTCYYEIALKDLSSHWTVYINFFISTGWELIMLILPVFLFIKKLMDWKIWYTESTTSKLQTLVALQDEKQKIIDRYFSSFWEFEDIISEEINKINRLMKRFKQVSLKLLAAYRS